MDNEERSDNWENNPQYLRNVEPEDRGQTTDDIIRTTNLEHILDRNRKIHMLVAQLMCLVVQATHLMKIGRKSKVP